MEVRAHKKSQLPEVARERGWKEKTRVCGRKAVLVVVVGSSQQKTTVATRTNWDRGVGNKDNSCRILHTKLLPESRASSFQVLELPSEIHIRTQHDPKNSKQRAWRQLVSRRTSWWW